MRERDNVTAVKYIKSGARYPKTWVCPHVSVTKHLVYGEPALSSQPFMALLSPGHAYCTVKLPKTQKSESLIVEVLFKI